MSIHSPSMFLNLFLQLKRLRRRRAKEEGLKYPMEKSRIPMRRFKRRFTIKKPWIPVLQWSFPTMPCKKAWKNKRQRRSYFPTRRRLIWTTRKSKNSLSKKSWMRIIDSSRSCKSWNSRSWPNKTKRKWNKNRNKSRNLKNTINLEKSK